MSVRNDLLVYNISSGTYILFVPFASFKKEKVEKRAINNVEP